MTFGDYYRSLGDDNAGRLKKRELLYKISTRIDRQLATLHNYINGRRRPVKVEREAIAKIIGKPVEELFPEEAHV